MLINQERNAMAIAQQDRDLVSLAVQGDTIALRELLLGEYRLLHAHISERLPRQLSGVESSDDLAQETLVKAIANIGSLQTRTAASFSAWLRAIADSCISHAVRRAGRKKRGGEWRRLTASLSSRSTLPDLAIDKAETPARAAARREATLTLGVEVAALPSEQREAIRLRYIEGNSLDETAAAMDRSPGAVRGLVYRAKAALRNALGRSSRWLGPR
jgi:RNA polymerase sigma-70 factor (ECF subfamily)